MMLSGCPDQVFQYNCIVTQVYCVSQSKINFFVRLSRTFRYRRDFFSNKRRPVIIFYHCLFRWKKLISQTSKNTCNTTSFKFSFSYKGHFYRYRFQLKTPKLGDLVLRSQPRKNSTKTLPSPRQIYKGLVALRYYICLLPTIADCRQIIFMDIFIVNRIDYFVSLLQRPLI